MSKKLGRRAQNQKRFLEEGARKAEELIARAADAEGVSPDRMRSRMAELAQVRAEMIERFRGTGMRVKDVLYDPVQDRISVKIEHDNVEMKTGFVDHRKLDFGTIRAQREAIRKGRGVAAQLELEASMGKAHTSLPFLIGVK